MGPHPLESRLSFSRPTGADGAALSGDRRLGCRNGAPAVYPSHCCTPSRFPAAAPALLLQVPSGCSGGAGVRIGPTQGDVTGHRGRDVMGIPSPRGPRPLGPWHCPLWACSVDFKLRNDPDKRTTCTLTQEQPHASAAASLTP
jgi:hypothetical protein